jgi:hypothetical protein
VVTTRESYAQLQQVQALRKKIEQLILSDALKDTDESAEAIKELKKQRDELLALLFTVDEREEADAAAKSGSKDTRKKEKVPK